MSCEPSALAGRRYNIAIETAVAPYMSFGAVLTQQELTALIQCLNAGLREHEEGEK